LHNQNTILSNQFKNCVFYQIPMNTTTLVVLQTTYYTCWKIDCIGASNFPYLDLNFKLTKFQQL